jgi:hypothetical protein
MIETENLEKMLNTDKNNVIKFTVSVRQRAYPVIYTDWMWIPMDEITRIKEVLKEFKLKIRSIGAFPKSEGMYIETEFDMGD